MKSKSRFLILFFISLILLVVYPTNAYAKGRTFILSVNGNQAETGKHDNMTDMILPIFYSNKLYNNSVKYDYMINYYNTKNSKTEKQVLDKIKNSFNGSHASDLGIFIYNGHGQEDGGILYKSGLSLKEDRVVTYKNLAKTLASTGCGKIIVIINACHSGYFIDKGIGSLTRSERSKFYVITSCGKYELSYKNENTGFSFYMDALSKSLSVIDNYKYKGYIWCDLNYDKKITFSELYKGSNNYFHNNYKKLFRFSQTPQRYSLNDDILFSYDVPSIKLNTYSKSMLIGQTIKLNVSTTGNVGTIYWKSSNSSVAAVSNGKVTAKKKGTAIITAYITVAGMKYSSSCNICVGSLGKIINLKAKSNKTKSITLEWKNSSGESEYRVYRSTDKNSGYQWIQSVSGTGFTDNNVSKGLTYYYKILPFIKLNQEYLFGTYSSVISVKAK